MADDSAVRDLDPFGLLDAEAERLYGFLSSQNDWTRDTKCAGWTRREMVAHLAAGGVYHKACLDDELQPLFAAGAEAGAGDLDSFNDWTIRLRADRSAQDVLDEWRALDVEIRRRMRERGRDATMASSIGPYPVGWMGFHVASEYATHADDMEVPIDESEAAGRLEWRVKVGLFAPSEKDAPPEVEKTSDGFLVRAGGKEATLSPSDFVAATVARLPDDHPLDSDVRAALRALA